MGRQERLLTNQERLGQQINCYTDGACRRPNPGQAGAAFIVYFPDGKLHSDRFYLGERTNNFAELVGIFHCLEWLVRAGYRHERIVIHTDSSYSIGVCSKGWVAKENSELIKEIRALTSGFAQLEWKWVKAHAGNIFNEYVDKLAVLSIYEHQAKAYLELLHEQTKKVKASEHGSGEDD